MPGETFGQDRSMSGHRLALTAPLGPKYCCRLRSASEGRRLS